MHRWFVLSIAIFTTSFSHAAERYVALTIDDLPSQRGSTIAVDRELTTQLIEHIRAAKAPTVGFVNEIKIFERGSEEVSARTALLAQWLDAGLELGNHTYSHVDINAVPFDEYARDLLNGEQIIRSLMRERGMTLRYFRHPYLRAGKDAETKAKLEQLLSEHQYTIAPVTIDNDEWIFGGAYDVAAKRGDRKAMRQIGEDYLRYMEQAFEFSEQLALQVAGRPIKQVLLVHANAMNAEYLDDLLAMTARRGYRFVSLSEALEDEIYRREDPYVGPKGWSWLLRWGVGRSLDLSEAPEVPEYVKALAGVQ